MTLIKKIIGGALGFITGLVATILTLPYLYYALARAQVIEQKWPWPKSILAVLTIGQVGILAGSPFVFLRALAFPLEGLVFGVAQGPSSAFKFPLYLHHKYKNCMVSNRNQAYANVLEENNFQPPEEVDPIQLENEAVMRQINELPRSQKPLTSQEIKKFEEVIASTRDLAKKEQLQKDLAAYELYLTNNNCVISGTRFRDLKDPLTVKCGNKENTYSEASLKEHISNCTTTFHRIADEPQTRLPLSEVRICRGFASTFMDFIAEVRKTLKSWVRPKVAPLTREEVREERNQFYTEQRLFGTRKKEEEQKASGAAPSPAASSFANFTK